MTYLIILIPILYGLIQALEMSSIIARHAGHSMGRSVTGYALQQSIYMGTRLFLVMLLPLLGFVVDAGFDAREYALMAHASLLLATIAGGLVVAIRNPMTRYYTAVLKAFDDSGSFISSFKVRPVARDEVDPVILCMPDAKRVFWLSVIVFTIYSAGIFISFYFALLIPEYRASISQLSGIVNALGAALLTFFVEPRIAQSMDRKSAQSGPLILSLLYGRLLAVAVTSQLLLLFLFWSVS